MNQGKKVLVVGVLMLAIMPIFVFAQEAAPIEAPAETTAQTQPGKFESIRNIQEAVRENTPGFITMPFVYLINKFEAIRTGALAWVEVRKAEIKLDLEELGGENIATTPEFFDAFKYLEVFLLIILIFVLSLKIIFYGIIIFLLLLVSRFFWYRIY